jgi:molybdopterin-guanine dinucleotide biosynthesis protein A
VHQGAVRVHVHASLTGVVLAGGRSSRFGRDKLAEPYRGAPILHHTLERVGAVCEEVVLVLAPGVPEPPLPRCLAVRIARDAEPYQGPLAGVRTGLLAARTELALLVGGDMPGLVPEVVAEMVRTGADPAVEAVALVDAGRSRPLPSLVRVEPAARAAGRLLEAGRRRLRDLFGALRVHEVAEATWIPLDPGRRSLLDVDVPADLEALER